MLELVIRMIGALLVIAGMLVLIRKFQLKTLGFTGKENAPLKVVARQNLSRTSSVVLINVNGKHLLLGASETGVSLLTEVDPIVEPEVTSDETGDFSSVMDTVAQTRQSVLTGSALSPATWKQAVAAMKGVQR